MSELKGFKVWLFGPGWGTWFMFLNPVVWCNIGIFLYEWARYRKTGKDDFPLEGL